MKQKKLIFNFFVNRNWKKLTDCRKTAKILADNRKSHHPIETLIENNKHPNFEWRGQGRGGDSFVLRSHPTEVQCLNKFVADCKLIKCRWFFCGNEFLGSTDIKE